MKKMLSIICTVALVLGMFGLNVSAAQEQPDVMPLAVATDSTVLTDGNYNYSFVLKCQTLCAWTTGKSESSRAMRIDLLSVTEIGNYVTDYAYGTSSIQADTYNPQDNEMLQKSYATCQVPGTALCEELYAGYN